MGCHKDLCLSVHVGGLYCELGCIVCWLIVDFVSKCLLLSNLLCMCISQQNMCLHSPKRCCRQYAQGDEPDQSRRPRILDAAQDPMTQSHLLHCYLL